jgi:hypothetical protein
MNLAILPNARIFLAVCLLELPLAGCGRDQTTTAAPAEIVIPDAVKNFDPKTYKPPMFNGVELYTGPHRTPKGMSGLTISGYNYTDSYIDSFTVESAGGGNLEVSSPSTIGGGACCASIPADTRLPIPVEIAWKRDGDVPWCRQTVLLEEPVPENGHFFEVHFYPDGTIQVAIADEQRLPRLKLDRFNRIQRKSAGNINNDSKFSECGYVR